jgi:hypothetical protein
MHTDMGKLMRKRVHSRGWAKKSLVAYRADSVNIIYRVSFRRDWVKGSWKADGTGIDIDTDVMK